MWWLEFLIKILILLSAVALTIIDALMWFVVFCGRSTAEEDAIGWAKGIGIAAVAFWIAFIIGAFV